MKIDLTTLFDMRRELGSRYRYITEEGGDKDCLSSVLLLCKWGHFYATGPDELAASVDGHPVIANKIRKLSFVEPIMDGDFGELTAVFPASEFKLVAEIMKPLTRRVLSPAHRAAFVKAGEAHRFISKNNGSESDSEARNCDPIENTTNHTTPTI